MLAGLRTVAAALGAGAVTWVVLQLFGSRGAPGDELLAVLAFVAYLVIPRSMRFGWHFATARRQIAERKVGELSTALTTRTTERDDAQDALDAERTARHEELAEARAAYGENLEGAHEAHRSTQGQLDAKQDQLNAKAAESEEHAARARSLEADLAPYRAREAIVTALDDAAHTIIMAAYYAGRTLHDWEYPDGADGRHVIPTEDEGPLDRGALVDQAEEALGPVRAAFEDAHAAGIDPEDVGFVRDWRVNLPTDPRGLLERLNTFGKALSNRADEYRKELWRRAH
jgi:hypothetical protein